MEDVAIVGVEDVDVGVVDGVVVDKVVVEIELEEEVEELGVDVTDDDVVTVVLVVEEVGEWKVTRYIADQTVSGVPIGGGKDMSKLDHWWGAGWRLANASGFPVRTSAASEGPSPVDRVLLVVEQD